VSLKETFIAVIDENDKLVWRGSVPSTHAPRAERIGRLVKSRPGSVSKPKVAP
jgi:hypothetical protein